MISANFVGGEIDRIYYFENPKNDAYPVVQLPPEEKEMKGFNWQPEIRPKGKQDITPLELRKSERLTYLARPMPRFDETNAYFPGHMKSIAKKLAEADSLRRVRHAEARERQALAELEAAQDSLRASEPADTLAVPKDSLGMTASPKDSLEALAGQPGQPSDSLTTIIAGIEPVTPGEPERELTPEEQRAARKAEAEAKRQARVDAREARWAELDARDAAKAAAKEAKALEKKRKATLRAVLAAEKEAARDQKRLDKYVRKYEKRKARRDARRGSRIDAPGDAPSKDTLEETL